jgi:hypothetical protein
VKDSQWFVDRIGKTIQRGARDLIVKDDRWAEYLYGLQPDCVFSDRTELAPCPTCGIIDHRKEK